MNKKILGVFLFAVFTMSSVWAQGRKGLRINEVLVTNETNYQDDYGCQSAWIEIFNTTFGTVDIRSCYLTNDRIIPKVSYSQRRCTYRNASSSAFAVLGR